MYFAPIRTISYMSCITVTSPLLAKRRSILVSSSHSLSPAIYAEEQRGSAYIPHLRCGDFTSGNAGIRMVLGDTLMGGEKPFVKDEKLLLAIGDFHESVRIDGHEYSMVLLDDKGVVFKSDVSPDTMQYFSFPVSETARWMRAEIFDDTRKLRIAMGNPIWNSKLP